MKILFLLPPSEGKNSENKYNVEDLTYEFDKPLEIAKNVTEKDLKCKWDRFLEWVELNKNINNSETNTAISRYSWVMFNAIDYAWMNSWWKTFFEDNFLMLSGMYWVVKPLDKIGNYKLPIETKWLYDFWWDILVEKIIDIKPDYIVNLLPISYMRLLWLANCKKHIYKRELILKSWIKIININFLKEDWNKISHWVKKIKWEWIKYICEKNVTSFEQFRWEVVNNWGIIDINIIK